MAAKKKLSETSVEEMCDLHDQVRDLPMSPDRWGRK